MLKQIIICVILVIIVSGATNYIQYRSNVKKVDELQAVWEEEKSELQAQIDTVAAMTEAFTVTTTVEYGDPVDGAHLETIRVPAESYPEENAVSLEELDGAYYRISIKPGTVITKDLVMREYSDYTMRETDLPADYFTSGLKVGDYFDVRVMFPEGYDFVAMSHLKLLDMYAETAHVRFNAVQMHAWRGLMSDYYLGKSEGMVIYFSRYIDPGVQPPSITDYPFNEMTLALIKADPNVQELYAGQEHLLPRTNTNRELINSLIMPRNDELYQKYKTGLQSYVGYMISAYSDAKNKVSSDSSDGGSSPWTDEDGDGLDDNTGLPMSDEQYQQLYY